MKQVRLVLNWAIVGVFVAFVAIQFVPVDQTNPPITGEVPAPAEVLSVLRRACYDCHSNETVWPWYSRIAPVSWQIADDVGEGRDALNFSAWDKLSTKEQLEAIYESGEEVTEGKMPPWFYVALHPEAHLSANDRSVLLTWSLSAGRVERDDNW